MGRLSKWLNFYNRPLLCRVLYDDDKALVSSVTSVNFTLRVFRPSLRADFDASRFSDFPVLFSPSRGRRAGIFLYTEWNGGRISGKSILRFARADFAAFGSTKPAPADENKFMQIQIDSPIYFPRRFPVFPLRRL